MYFEEKKKVKGREKQDQKVLFSFFKAKRQGSEIVPKETKQILFSKTPT